MWGLWGHGWHIFASETKQTWCWINRCISGLLAVVLAQEALVLPTPKAFFSRDANIMAASWPVLLPSFLAFVKAWSATNFWKQSIFLGSIMPSPFEAAASPNLIKREEMSAAVTQFASFVKKTTLQHESAIEMKLHLQAEDRMLYSHRVVFLQKDVNCAYFLYFQRAEQSTDQNLEHDKLSVKVIPRVYKEMQQVEWGTCSAMWPFLGYFTALESTDACAPHRRFRGSEKYSCACA